MVENINKAKSLVKLVSEDLEEKILNGTLKPGQRLIEAELCRTYNISQSPLREALRILENQSCVIHKPRKGVFVTEVTIDDIEETYLLRANLEGLATYLAVKNNNPEVLANLKKTNQQLIEAAAQKNIKAYVALHGKFHKIIINASQNKRLIQMLQTFVKQTERFRLWIFQEHEAFDSSIEAHESIIRLFESGNAEKAERERKKNILRIVKIFLEKMNLPVPGE